MRANPANCRRLQTAFLCYYVIGYEHSRRSRGSWMLDGWLQVAGATRLRKKLRRLLQGEHRPRGGRCRPGIGRKPTPRPPLRRKLDFGQPGGAMFAPRPDLVAQELANELGQGLHRICHALICRRRKVADRKIVLTLEKTILTLDRLSSGRVQDALSGRPKVATSTGASSGSASRR